MTNEFTVEDIDYLRHGETPLLARLYRPAGQAPRAGIFEVHGGAWTTNDRTANVAIHEALARAGFAVFAVDFRMPPEAQYPASIRDINFGLRYFKARADEFGLEGRPIGGLGTSSGGHQLALMALRPSDPRYASIPLAGVAADASLAFMILCWPITDPLARYRMVTTNGNDRLAAAHRAYWPDEAAMADANPQLILERGEAKAPLPPALVLQGLRDDNVTPDMADRFAAAYRRAGGALELMKFPEQPHAFIARDPETADSRHALDLITGFVGRHAS